MNYKYCIFPTEVPQRGTTHSCEPLVLFPLSSLPLRSVLHPPGHGIISWDRGWSSVCTYVVQGQTMVLARCHPCLASCTTLADDFST